MKQHDFIDLGKMFDDIFAAAGEFSAAFGGSNTERRDFYPAYAYPPTNVYLTTEKELVIEFALAGFHEADLNLEFVGDHLVFSAKAPKDYPKADNAQFFKHRLKIKTIERQKYYVPADKFDQEAVAAIYQNGILRVCIPPKAETEPQEGIKVAIKTQK